MNIHDFLRWDGPDRRVSPWFLGVGNGHVYTMRHKPYTEMMEKVELGVRVYLAFGPP